MMPRSASAKLNGIDVHVEETRDRLRRRVRVQRREDQVAGERRLDADRRRLVVAHLADHDHVGIGAQERAHRRGEGEVDLRLHLHLAQTLLRDFDRVLRRPDLHVLGVDEAEGGVQRRRLAGAGRTDHEADAVRLLQDRLERGQVALAEAHLVERQRLRRGQDAHDHVFVLFAVGIVATRSSIVPFEYLKRILPSCGLRRLGDVELGHDLEALHERVAVRRRGSP